MKTFRSACLALCLFGIACLPVAAQVPDCNNAVPLACGAVLTNQTTAGAGNNFQTSTNYTFQTPPAGATPAFTGLDRIYSITVPEVTAVRIMLTVTQPNSNLDLLLLNGCAAGFNTVVSYSVEGNTGANNHESIQYTLQPGITYYLIVDNSSPGGAVTYNLRVECACTCLEPMASLPDGDLILCDNFETYIPTPTGNGNLDFQSNRWRAMDDMTDFALVQATGGNQYARFQGLALNTTDPNMLYLLDNRTTGKYRLSWRMQVPAGKRAYFGTLHAYPSYFWPYNPAANVAMQVFFDLNNAGRLILDPVGSSQGDTTTFAYPTGGWFNVVFIVDLDGTAAGTSLFINNQFVRRWNFNESATGAIPTDVLGALNFYALNQNYDFLIDDLCVWRRKANCTATPVPLQTCIRNGDFFADRAQARCELYTPLEWWDCYTACDLGGTFIYRGDQVQGDLTSTDFLFPSDPSPVAGLGCEDVQPNYFMDVYIFYDEEQNGDLQISNFNASSPQTQFYVFGCNVLEGGSCEYKKGPCLLTEVINGIQIPTALRPCNSFYFVTVIGPAGDDYTFSVVPTGPCTVDPPELPEGTSGILNISGGNSQLSTADGSYSHCYGGNRAYLDGEEYFKFTVTQPSSVTITLTSNNEMGVSLYSFLCGKNCIDFAETSPGSPVATLTATLVDGTYYVVVDKNAGATDDFIIARQTAALPNFTNYTAIAAGLPACPVNATQKHTVLVNHTGYTFTAQEQLYFLYPDNGQLKSSALLYYNIVNPNQDILMELNRDDTSDAIKCSYNVGDTLKVMLVSNATGKRTISELVPMYAPPNGSTITATKDFTVNGYSRIDAFTVKDVVTFGASTAELNPGPASGPIVIAFNASLPWATVGVPAWITMDPTSAGGGDDITFTFQPNPGEAPRSATIEFYAVDHPDLYRQYLQVRQQGTCPTTPQLAVSATQTTLCQGQTATLTAVTAPGAEAIYNYVWSTGATTPSIAVTTSGNYSVTITSNQLGCSATNSAAQTIAVVPAPTASAGPQQTLKCSPATVTLNGSGSTPGLTYLWTGPAGATITGATTLMPTVNRPGLYTLLVTTNTGGCSATSTVQVEADTVRPQANAGAPQVMLCSPPTVTLQGSASPNTTAQWQGPGLVSGANTLMPVVNQAGSYVLTVTSSANGCTRSASTTVTANQAPPTVGIAQPSVLTCTQPSQVLQGTASGSGTIAYQWTGPGLVSPNGLSTITVDQPGSYVLTATRGDNGCTASASVTVTADKTPPSVNVPATGPTLQCNQSSITLQATAATGPTITYLWTGPGVISDPAVLNPTVTAAGTYLLLVTNTANGCTATGSTTVTGSNAAPTVTLGTPPVLSCSQPTATLTATAGAGTTYAYAWLGPNILSGAQTATPLVGQPGTYVLTVTNLTNGCTSVYSTQVTGNTTPPSVVVATPTPLSCPNPASTITATVSPAGTYTYLWQGPGIVSGQATAQILAGQSGAYSVTVTDAATGCSQTATTPLTGSSTPPAANAGPPQLLRCEPPTVLLQGSGSAGLGITYAWQGPNIVSGGNTLTPAVGQPGTYSLTVTDPGTQCTAESTTTVTSIIAFPTASAGADQTLTCTQTSVVLQGTGSTGAGFSYQWSGPGTIVNGSTLTPTVGQSGVFVLTVTNTGNGCTASDTTVVQADINVPQVGITSTGSITCLQSTVQLDATGSAGPQFLRTWSGPGIGPGVSAPGVTVSQGGTYSLTVVNTTNNCSATASILVAVNNQAPVLTVPPVHQLLCQPPILLIQATVAGASAATTYSWSGPGIFSGQQQLNPVVYEPGTYVLTAVDTISGCTATASTLVQDQQIPVAATATVNHHLYCVPATVVLSAGPSGAQYAYTWSGPGLVSGGTTATAVANAAGLYVVTIVNSTNGCTGTASVGVTTENSPPMVDAGPTQLLPCNPSTIVIDASDGTQPGLAYQWSGAGIVSGASTIAVTVNAIGTYTLLVTNPLTGCTASDFTNVVADQVPPTAQSGPPQTITCANNQTVQLQGQYAPGAVPATFQWLGPGIASGSASLSPIVNAPGDYRLIVTLQTNGCTDTSGVVTVAIDTQPPGGTAGNDVTLCPGSVSPVQLGAGNSTDFTYLWSPAAGLSSPTAPSPVATPSAPRTYTVVITNPLNLCTLTDSMTIGFWPALDAGVGLADSIACAGQSTGALQAEVTGGTPGYSIVWSTGATGPQLAGVPAGSYTFSVTDANGCSTATTAFTLTEPPPLGIDTILVSPALGQNNGAIEITVSGGTPAYSYQWLVGGQPIAGQSGSVLDSLAPNTAYAVIVTDGNGCTTSESGIAVTVRVPEPDLRPYVSVFPNPHSGQFYVRATFPAPIPVDVAVFDLLGREVFRDRQPEVTAYTWSVDLRAFAAGPFAVRLASGRSVLTINLLYIKP